MSDTTPPNTSSPSDAGLFSQKNLRQRFFWNTAALVVGTNLNAIGRLATAALIVRSLGREAFGEYALLLVWLSISEWILDFGASEIFVREANQAPERRNHLARILFAMKSIQVPVAALVLMTGLIAMRYPQKIVVAGMLSSLSLLFLAAAVVCRPVFKATLTMGREIAADFVSVISMIAMVLLVSHWELGLMGLMAAYAVSRLIFSAGCLLLSRSLIHLSVGRVSARDLRWGFESSFAIGLIGFIMVAYSATDLLVLSRMASLADVATYSAAQRFTNPLMMALSAIAVSVYPVLALLKDPARFRETCQKAVDTIVLVSCFALVSLWCSAEFFMSLLGPDFVTGADALRVLAATCVIRAVAALVGPILFLVRAQQYALRFSVAALVVKIAVMVAITPTAGYLGAAVGSMIVEGLFLLPVTLYFVHAHTGFTIRLSGTLRIAAVTVGVIAVTRLVLPQGNIAGLVVAATLYGVLVLALRIVRPSELRTLLRRNSV